MRLYFVTLLLVEAVLGSSRLPRDIGLHLNSQHHHHGHHNPAVAASQSHGVGHRGYGNETPNPPLSADLQLPEDSKKSKDLVLLPQEKQNPGYLRENPSVPFHYPAGNGDLDLQTSFKEKNANDFNGGSRQAQQGSTGSEIPGQAGKDFPVFATVPVTKFDCRSQQWPGYYADEEALCQVFHICYDNRKDSFLCPNGTLFHQKYFVCDWWYSVDCAASKGFFQLNSQIGVVPEKAPVSGNQHAGQQVNSAGLNLVSQQIVGSFVHQEPNLNYLPPQLSPASPGHNEKPDVVISPEHSANHLKPSQSYLPPEIPPALPEPKVSEMLPVLTQSAFNAPHVPQSYLPPLHDQVQKQDNPSAPALTVPESVAPTEDSSQAVAAPGTFYLPPAIPDQALKVPDLMTAAVSEQKILAAAAVVAPESNTPPSLAYIPPKESASKGTDSTVRGISQLQIPTRVANIPTAMEALANGILTIPDNTQTNQHKTVAEPSTDYLPPPL